MPDEPPTSKHKAAPSLWYYYRQLPPEVQKLADKNFELLERDLRHPSLQFKKVGKIWSARIGRDYRALATQIPIGFLWFWIGTHREYESKLK
jgi:hypothetical protein